MERFEIEWLLTVRRFRPPIFYYTRAQGDRVNERTPTYPAFTAAFSYGAMGSVAFFVASSGLTVVQFLTVLFLMSAFRLKSVDVDVAAPCRGVA